MRASDKSSESRSASPESAMEPSSSTVGYVLRSAVSTSWAAISGSATPAPCRNRRGMRPPERARVSREMVLGAPCSMESRPMTDLRSQLANSVPPAVARCRMELSKSDLTIRAPRRSAPVRLVIVRAALVR